MDQHFYQTSEFAQKASITVRTLRYYDNVGLLSPSSYTEAGYRLYTETDFSRLQQILALKFLGFSLEEIQHCLQTGPTSLRESLALQKAMMHEKRVQLDAIIRAINETEELLQENNQDWESIVKVIQVIQMTQTNDWHKKYFTDEQLRTMEELDKKASTEQSRQKLKAIHPYEWTETDQERVNEQYRFIKQELARLVAIGADPASPEAQNIAHIRHELLFGFSQGDPDIEASVGKWWQEFHALPEEQRPFDISLYTYTSEEQDLLAKAMTIYQQHTA